MDKAGVVDAPLDENVAPRVMVQRVIERMIAPRTGSRTTPSCAVPPVRGAARRDRRVRRAERPGDGRRTRVLDVSCGLDRRGSPRARRAPRHRHRLSSSTWSRSPRRKTGDRRTERHVPRGRRRRGPFRRRGRSTRWWSAHALLAPRTRRRARVVPQGPAPRRPRRVSHVRSTGARRQHLRRRPASTASSPAVRALRWLVPTAVFETFRDCEHRYPRPTNSRHASTRFRDRRDPATFSRRVASRVGARALTSERALARRSSGSPGARACTHHLKARARARAFALYGAAGRPTAYPS